MNALTASKNFVAGAAGAFAPEPTRPIAGGWRGALAVRRYVDEVKFSSEAELSARIEHGDESFYFPLGTGDPEVAAAKAQNIKRLIRSKGWAAAKKVFPREFALAFFWSACPLTCTYTSLYSVPVQIPPRWLRHAQSQRKTCRAVIIEPEEAVRKATAFWVDRQSGFFCDAGFASISEAVSAAEPGRVDLLLVNRDLTEKPGALPLECIRKKWPTAKFFGFGIYEESNYIFHSVTGVKSGYVLCRRSPRDVFDPIRALADDLHRPGDLLERDIQNYFQSLFVGQKNGTNQPSDKLTPREHDVLMALAKGLSEKEVAGALLISTLTVHNHVKRIYSKFGAHSRTEAVLKYLGR